MLPASYRSERCFVAVLYSRWGVVVEVMLDSRRRTKPVRIVTEIVLGRQLLATAKFGSFLPQTPENADSAVDGGDSRCETCQQSCWRSLRWPRGLGRQRGRLQR